MDEIPEREVTPRELYFSRRAFLRGGVIAAGAAATAFAYRKINGVDLVETKTAAVAGVQRPSNPAYRVNEAPNTLAQITNYNNFYEFTTNKDGVASASHNFKTDGWMVDV